MSKNNKILERSDNWQKFSYINYRFLDSLAELFNIVSPCSSVKKDEQNKKFVISYNKSVKSGDDKFKKPEFLIKNIIKELSSACKNDIIKALPFYLIFNQDFYNSIKIYSTKKNDKITDNFCKNISSIKSSLQLYYECIRQEENNSIPKLVNSVFNPIKKNQGVINFITDKFSLDTNINIITHVKNNPNEICQVIDYVLKYIEKEYNDFFVEKEEVLKANSILAEKMIRPIQDLLKLKYVFEEKQQYKEFNFEVIQNPDLLHTETNQSTNVNKNDYIGISKLSCAPCHMLLDELEILHRGTHGVYDNWPVNDSVQLLNIKKQADLYCTDDNSFTGEIKKERPVMTRDLSYDNLELHIPNLLKLKKDLNLICIDDATEQILRLCPSIPLVGMSNSDIPE